MVLLVCMISTGLAAALLTIFFSSRDKFGSYEVIKRISLYKLCFGSENFMLGDDVDFAA